MEHQEAAFVTLTYRPEALPPDGQLVKRDVQLFLKKLRERVSPRLIRYFFVGEYGDKSWRPHYHAIIYGLSPVEDKVVADAWEHGFVQVGTAESGSMSYVASYVVKKMTSPKDKRLNGRVPEFTLMSRRPGIGFGVVKRIVEAYTEGQGKVVRNNYDKVLARTVRLGSKEYPLGRYLREKVYDALSVGELERSIRRQKVVDQVLAKSAVFSASEAFNRRKAQVAQQRQVRIRKEML